MTAPALTSGHQALLLSAFRTLEHLTTEEFAHGGDRPVRVALATVLHPLGLIDDETAYEHGVISASELAERKVTSCAHCGRTSRDDDGTWYHPDTMTARCDGPDDEPGLFWSDMVRQAEPKEAQR